MGVRVHIFDKEYNLKANEDEGYLKTIAAYVDNKVRRIASSIPQRGGEQISILACLNIADELYKLREKTREARERVQQLIEKIEKEAR
jgi:cell division protein ZapA